MTQPKNYYRRNLPHWHPAGKSFFLTWRLHGSLRYAHLYTLWAYVVMANHVHVFLKPKGDATIDRITKQLKGFTAREANLFLGRTGQKFWQDESFDHWSRDKDEFSRIVKYIENNPVKAGLVKRPEDWPWSSAAERKRRGWREFKALT
ncbi:MAG: transposase [Acidobacteriota bacterium]|nr:transposase [Acidobacteriota bacterium]